MQQLDLQKRKRKMRTNENLYRGKKRGYYDPTETEVFFTKLTFSEGFIKKRLSAQSALTRKTITES